MKIVNMPAAIRLFAEAQAIADEKGQPVHVVVNLTSMGEPYGTLDLGWALPSNGQWKIARMPDGSEQPLRVGGERP